MTAPLELIAKLLAQAEGKGVTEAEAEAFNIAAQRIATANSVDLAKARNMMVAKERTLPVQREIVIGVKHTVGMRTLVDLYLGIADANDVRCLIAHNATRVYAYGYAEDIDVSEALYASLLTQMTEFVAQYKAEGSWADETVYIKGYHDHGWHPGGHKQISWRTARLNFQEGFANRIKARLMSAKREEEQRQRGLDRERAARPHLDDDGSISEAFAAWFEQYGDEFDSEMWAVDLLDLDDSRTAQIVAFLNDPDDVFGDKVLSAYRAYLANASTQPAGTELVLASKHEAVDEFFAPHHKNARGSYKSGAAPVRSGAAIRAGGAAASKASLSGRTALGGSKKGIGR